MRQLKRRHARSRRPGFTLIEVMVAMMLGMTMLGCALGLLMTTIFSTGFAGSLQVATRLGQETIDRTLTETWATMGTTASACQSTTQTIYSSGATKASGAGDMLPYQRSCTVTAMASGMRSIRVTVQWVDSSNRAHTVQLGAQRAP